MPASLQCKVRVRLSMGIALSSLVLCIFPDTSESPLRIGALEGSVGECLFRSCLHSACEAVQVQLGGWVVGASVEQAASHRTPIARVPVTRVRSLILSAAPTRFGRGDFEVHAS